MHFEEYMEVVEARIEKLDLEQNSANLMVVNRGDALPEINSHKHSR